MNEAERKRIRESIPEECPRTLEHVGVHLRSAGEAHADGDAEQLAHDASLAARLLLCIAWDAGATAFI